MSETDTVQRLPHTPVLETARLVLRPVRMDDAPACQAKFPHWEVVRYLAGKVPWPYPDDGAETHLRISIGEMERGEKFHWAITLKGADEMIGRIDLWPSDGSREQRGFWLETAQQGRGLITEAAERVTEYAFVDLGWPQLYLGNAEINTASHRVKEKQGATLIDREPMEFVYGPGVRVVWLLKREDWLARRAADQQSGKEQGQ